MMFADAYSVFLVKGYHFELFAAGMSLAEKSAAITAIETTLTPCTEIGARSVSLSDTTLNNKVSHCGDGSIPRDAIR